MFLKLLLTTILVLGMMTRAFYYNVLNYRSQAAILQLQDSNELSALGRAAANATVSPLVWIVVFVLFYAIWRKEIYMLYKKLTDRSTGTKGTVANNLCTHWGLTV